jgi:hypothetical protein
MWVLLMLPRFGGAKHASGHTHGCTDQQRNVKFPLANQEPSTHGTKPTISMGVISSAVNHSGPMLVVRI